MNFSIKPMLVTPKYAEELLKMNSNNRSVRQSKVDSLAESMKKGEWELSNDAITISEGNVLLNGQHRLLAVIKSGVPCNFIIYTGAPDSSFDIMDTPALRKISDVIQRKGGTNTVRAQTVISYMSRLMDDYKNKWETIYRFDRNSTWTRKESITYYDNNSEAIAKWLNYSCQTIERNIALVPITSLAAFGLFLETILKHPEEKILEFFRQLIIDGKTNNTTILYARRKLLRHKTKVELLPRGDDARLVFRAWNDFVLGKQVQIIKTNEDSFRYIYPI